jgi:hypothetical protein
MVMIFLCVFYKEFTVDDYFIKREFRIKLERLARDGQMSIPRFPSSPHTHLDGMHTARAPAELIPSGPEVTIVGRNHLGGIKQSLEHISLGKVCWYLEGVLADHLLFFNQPHRPVCLEQVQGHLLTHGTQGTS